jgi:hypothetical protein
VRCGTTVSLSPRTAARPALRSRCERASEGLGTGGGQCLQRDLPRDTAPAQPPQTAPKSRFPALTAPADINSRASTRTRSARERGRRSRSSRDGRCDEDCPTPSRSQPAPPKLRRRGTDANPRHRRCTRAQPIGASQCSASNSRGGRGDARPGSHGYRAATPYSCRRDVGRASRRAPPTRGRRRCEVGQGRARPASARLHALPPRRVELRGRRGVATPVSSDAAVLDVLGARGRTWAAR